MTDGVSFDGWGVVEIWNKEEMQIMKLFQVADRYYKENGWKNLTLLKICLFSIGILIEILVPKAEKKTVFGIEVFG